MLKKSLFLLFFVSQLYGADDLSAIGFFNGEKVRIAFVRTTERWQSACFYEDMDIAKQANAEHCAKNLFDKPWDIIDYQQRHIKAGPLEWVAEHYFVSGMWFSFQTLPKIKVSIPENAPKMYMWGGEVYHPLLVVPSGTEIKKIPSTIPKKVGQQLKNKLTTLYLQKKRKIYGCKEETEERIFEKAARTTDIAVTPIGAFWEGYSFYELALNLPKEAQYCGLSDSESELWAVKGSTVIDLTKPFRKIDLPLTVSLTFYGEFSVSIGEKKEILFMMLVSGYNINGFVLFDGQLNLLGSSLWGYH